MKRVLLLLVPALVMALVAAVASHAGPSRDSAPTAAKAATGPTTPVKCYGTRRGPVVGLMAPITGPASFLGVEQRNWGRFYFDRFRARSKRYRNWRLQEGDTQLPNTARAVAVAERLAANSRVLAVVGPAGSQEVLASSPVLRRAGIPFVSPSATRVDLTNGSHRGFFRVVPHDGVQAPTVGRYIGRTLRWRRVVVVDDQSSYGQPLADAIAAELRRNGVTDVSRESARPNQPSYAPLVARFPRNTQGVVLAWQIAADAQILAREMAARGIRATIFGTDGLWQPGAFNVNGSYISFFAPYLKTITTTQARTVVRAYNRRFGSNWGGFGPPTYVAVDVVTRAIVRACRNGTASRREVQRLIARTRITRTLLNQPLRFTALGDVVPQKFFIFRIQNGNFVQVA